MLRLFALLAADKALLEKGLRFRDDHTFTILQLTDLHYGENEIRNQITSDVQNALIKQVQPDLVVVTGDSVNGYEYDPRVTGFFEYYWRKFTKPYLDNKVPYAFVFGNHDTEADLSMAQIAALEANHPYSLFNGTDKIDPLSFSNYLLSVKSAFPGQTDQSSMLLWMLDSKSKGCLDKKDSYGCINQAQLDWYAREGSGHRTASGQKVKGFAFFHIPFEEFYKLYKWEATSGARNEATGCPMVNSGAYEAFLKEGNINGVFCGHDHSNDYFGFYHGIWLFYGRKTGYGSYSQEGMKKGGRVIKATEHIDKVTGDVRFTWRSFVVEEDGNVIKNEKLRRRGSIFNQWYCHGRSFIVSALAATVLSAFSLNM